MVLCACKPVNVQNPRPVGKQRSKRGRREFGRSSEIFRASAAEGGEMLMDEETFQQKLKDLVEQIQVLPEEERSKLFSLAQETRQRHEKLKNTINSLHDAIDYLRVSIKYLMFDLEATKRENQYLRKLLENDKDS
jgi:seryl-tRNA synthetase